MTKNIIIFAIFLFGQICGWTQNDSIKTIKLQRINDYGKPIEKSLNPYHGIYIITNKKIKYRFDNLRYNDESLISMENDTILFSDIDYVLAQRKSADRFVIGTSSIIVGLLCIPIAAVFEITIGEKPASEFDSNYKNRANANHIYAALISTSGVGLIVTGIKTMTSRKFDTKNKWIIKKGQFAKK